MHVQSYLSVVCSNSTDVLHWWKLLVSSYAFKTAIPIAYKSSQLFLYYFCKPEMKAGNKMVSLNPVTNKCVWGGNTFPSLLTWMELPCSGHWQNDGASYTVLSNVFYQLLILWVTLFSMLSFIQFRHWSRRFWAGVFICVPLLYVSSLGWWSPLYLIKARAILQ